MESDSFLNQDETQRSEKKERSEYREDREKRDRQRRTGYGHRRDNQKSRGGQKERSERKVKGSDPESGLGESDNDVNKLLKYHQSLQQQACYSEFWKYTGNIPAWYLFGNTL